MGMTFVSNRQRRQGEHRNQNDRGGNARKLSLQAHTHAYHKRLVQPNKSR
jgi:hypothetical protein